MGLPLGYPLAYPWAYPFTCLISNQADNRICIESVWVYE